MKCVYVGTLCEREPVGCPKHCWEAFVVKDLFKLRGPINLQETVQSRVQCRQHVAGR